MLYAILIAILIVLITVFSIGKSSKRSKEVFFVGPHCSGKTEAIVAMLGLDISTVPSLISHSVIVDGVKITEIPQRNDKKEFIDKFRIEEKKQYVFFIKNEEEFENFPVLRDFNVKFVFWRKESRKTNKDIFYLDESPNKLKEFIRKRL